MKKIVVIVGILLVFVAVYVISGFLMYKKPHISMKSPKIEGAMFCTINGNYDDQADVYFKQNKLQITKYSPDRSGNFETEEVSYELIGDKKAQGEKMYQKLVVKDGKFLKGEYEFLSVRPRENFENSYWYFHLIGDRELKCQIDETKVPGDK